MGARRRKLAISNEVGFGMRRLVLASLLVLGIVGPALAATTPAPRVALVIGNSA